MDRLAHVQYCLAYSWYLAQAFVANVIVPN